MIWFVKLFKVSALLLSILFEWIIGIYLEYPGYLIIINCPHWREQLKATSTNHSWLHRRVFLDEYEYTAYSCNVSNLIPFIQDYPEFLSPRNLHQKNQFPIKYFSSPTLFYTFLKCSHLPKIPPLSYKGYFLLFQF